jgi:hypothetical protein
MTAFGCRNQASTADLKGQRNIQMETLATKTEAAKQPFGEIQWDDEQEEAQSTDEKIPYFKVKNGESKVFRLLTQPKKHWVHFGGKDSDYWQVPCNGKGKCFVCDRGLKYDAQKALGVGNKSIYRCVVWNQTDGAFQVYTMGVQVHEQVCAIRQSEEERRNVAAYDFRITAKKGNTPYYHLTALTSKPLADDVIEQLNGANFGWANIPSGDQIYLAKMVGNALDLI